MCEIERLITLKPLTSSMHFQLLAETTEMNGREQLKKMLQVTPASLKNSPSSSSDFA